jgi:hypothetical protein
LQSAIDEKIIFKNFIAGSPFIGNSDSMQIVFAWILEERNYKGLEYKSIISNDFDHMDALIPTWSRGLRYILRYN